MMNRIQLIESIIQSSGQPFVHGSRSRDRLEKLDIPVLQRLESDSRAALENGRRLNVRTAASAERIADLIFKSEAAHQAFKAAVEQWAEVGSEGATPSPAVTSAAVPATRLNPVAQTSRPQTRSDRSSVLARQLLRDLVDQLTGGRARQATFDKVERHLTPAVAQYLDIEMDKIILDVSQMILADRAIGVGRLMSSDLMRPGPHRQLAVHREFYPGKKASESAVMDALARSVFCYGILAPRQIIVGPRSQAFGDFLKTCDHAFRTENVTLNGPRDHADRADTLVVVESATDPEVVHGLIEQARAQSGEGQVYAICLLGTPRMRQAKDSNSILTMVTTAGDTVDTPWHGAGSFRTEGEQLVFGAGSAHPFHVSKAYLAERFRHVADKTAIAT